MTVRWPAMFGDGGTPQRLAVVSTPRSGNSWLRVLLRVRFGLAEVVIHDPDELPVEPPIGVVIQLHWDDPADLVGYFADHDVQIVTIARHPLDVLVSMLHFASHEAATAQWLRADLTRSLVGQDPRSDAFRQFATGTAAKRLLSITPTWWSQDATHRVRYEVMVADRAAEFGRLGAELAFTPSASLADAASAGRFDVFAGMANHHGWQGRPGLWRELLPAELALEIFAANRDAFDVAGYECDPDLDLTPDAALDRWYELRIAR